MEKFMWNTFTDFELVTLAGKYGLDVCEFSDNLILINRAQVEKFLTEYEMCEAFGDK
jgi:hypothetical protein